MANNLKINTSIVFSLISVFCGYSFNLKFMLDTLGGKILNDKQVSYTLIGKKMFEKDKNKIIEMKIMIILLLSLKKIL